MSQHEIKVRIENYVAFVIGLVFLGALLANAQHKDENDARIVRQQVTKEARAAAQPDTWPRLDPDAKK
jgi:hypothetical protein